MTGSLYFLYDRIEGFAKLSRCGEGAIADRLCGFRRDPEQSTHVFIAGKAEQTVYAFFEQRCGNVAIGLPFVQQATQIALVLIEQFATAGWRLDRHVRHFLGQRTFEIGGEQHRLTQRRFTAETTKFVEQRQQDNGNVPMSALQAFQIVRQLDGSAAEGGAGLFPHIGDFTL